MKLVSGNIEKIYESKVADKYDFSIPPFFTRWKKKAFYDSSLKKGDTVLVFCCGTGLDFPHILKKIGKEGKIVGVDFSSEMLSQAKEKIRKNRWENIELIEADITKFTKVKSKIDSYFDVGVCTLGMSIIPGYKQAYSNLVSFVKKQGEIIIGDMQLASGWFGVLDPVTIFLSKKFGGTREGHQNSKELYAIMQKDLSAVVKKEFFFKAYYYCIGKKQ
ncbi:MAG: methyltransferase domain-containing protein [Leptospirales bacterium]